MVSKILKVDHIGMHTCPPKPKKYRSPVREVVLRNSAVGVHAIQQVEVGETVTPDDLQEACRRAMHLSCTNLRYEKANLTQVKNWRLYFLKKLLVWKMYI